MAIFWFLRPSKRACTQRSQRSAFQVSAFQVFLNRYFEEEAVISYTEYLKEIEEGKIDNVKAPEIAINYWNLPLNSKLKDVIKVIRDDEAGHRDVNHSFANILNNQKNNCNIDNKNNNKKISNLKI